MLDAGKSCVLECAPGKESSGPHAMKDSVQDAHSAAVIPLPDSLRTFLKFERFHLHRADKYQVLSRDPAFDTHYLPQRSAAFQLPCYFVRRKRVQIFGDQRVTTFKWAFGYPPDDIVLFAVHPTALRDHAEFLSKSQAEPSSAFGVKIWAVPTSSTRTVVAWEDRSPEKAIFLKTSLTSPLFGDRRLTEAVVARSVGMSALLSYVGCELPEDLRFMPEPAGIVPKGYRDTGLIVREIPEEIRKGTIIPVPLFALASHGPDQRPLLLTIAERAGLKLNDFLEDVLCRNFSAMWVDLTMRAGLCLEAHGQDLLLALSSDLVPINRFYYRDFEGLQVDWGLRASFGKTSPTALPRADRFFDTYYTWGHPCSQLAWYKLHVSLYGYVHLVLREIDESISTWASGGLIDRAVLRRESLTSMFSRHLRLSLGSLADVRDSGNYDICNDLSRFVRFLMRVRRELMESAGVQRLRPV